MTFNRPQFYNDARKYLQIVVRREREAARLPARCIVVLFHLFNFQQHDDPGR